MIKVYVLDFLYYIIFFKQSYDNWVRCKLIMVLQDDLLLLGYTLML